MNKAKRNEGGEKAVKRIIVASHAAFAKGIVSSLELIAGSDQPVDVIEGFTVDENPAEKFDEIMAVYDENDKVIVLTDLTAGSVNKSIAEKLRNKNFYLISGMNLTILLGLALAAEEMIDDAFIEEVIESGRNDICFMNRSIAETDTPAEEDFLT